MSLFVLQSGAELALLGDGYVEPEAAVELESASNLLQKFASEAQSQYATWASEKESSLEGEALKIRAEERLQVSRLLESTTAVLQNAIEQASAQETERIRSALTSVLSDQAAEWLIAAAIAKATESGLIDAEAKVLVPEYARDRLIENLGQLIPFDDYLFLMKVVEEHDYVTEGSAIVVTPVEAFKFDAVAITRSLLS